MIIIHIMSITCEIQYEQRRKENRNSIAGTTTTTEVWEERKRGWGMRLRFSAACLPAMHALNPKP